MVRVWLNIFVFAPCGQRLPATDVSLRPTSPCDRRLPATDVSLRPTSPCDRRLPATDVSLRPTSPCDRRLSETTINQVFYLFLCFSTFMGNKCSKTISWNHVVYNEWIYKPLASKRTRFPPQPHSRHNHIPATTTFPPQPHSRHNHIPTRVNRGVLLNLCIIYNNGIWTLPRTDTSPNGHFPHWHVCPILVENNKWY